MRVFSTVCSASERLPDDCSEADGTRRGVDADHLGLWKRRGEMLRRVSEATPEVEDATRWALVAEQLDQMADPTAQIVLLVVAGHTEPAIELLVIFPTPIEEGLADAGRHFAGVP